jgi:ribosomal protein L11 methyltransferase
LAHWRVGVLAHWRVGGLAHWWIGALGSGEVWDRDCKVFSILGKKSGNHNHNHNLQSQSIGQYPHIQHPMNYIQYHIIAESAFREVLLAFLSELPFDTFEETEDGFRAYLPEGTQEEFVEQRLAELGSSYAFSFRRESIPYQNWNALWESNFQPVRVDNFCGIRADFHPPFTDVRHQIVINPRMAFGTGHHETTYMMIQLMRHENFRGAKTLDYGCGTGILAILAAKLGATIVDAVDVEEESYENTIQNAQLNNVDSIHAIHGTLYAVLDTGYDIILANINRNVILDSLSALYQKLEQRGVLLVSGILQKDLDGLVQAAEAAKFTRDDLLRRGEWAAVRFLK